jgi:hypothetical protein
VIIVDKPPILLQKTGIEEEGATLYVRACHTGPEVPLSAAAIHTYVSMLHDSRSSFVLLLLPVHGRRRGKKKDGAKWGSTPRLARYQTPSVTAFFLSCTNGSLAQQQPQSFRSGRRPRLLVYRARRRHHRKQIHRQETDPFVPSSRFGSVHGHVLACVTAHASGWWLATRVRSCGESRGKPVWSALFTYVHVRADSL